MSGKTDKNSKNTDIKADTGKGVQGSRRRALKALVAGGALGSASLLPERWLKPVVESVVVPAHAQLSPSACTGGCFDLTGGLSGSLFVDTAAGQASLYLTTGCSGMVDTSFPIVLASSAAEAAPLLSCPLGDTQTVSASYGITLDCPWWRCD